MNNMEEALLRARDKVWGSSRYAKYKYRVAGMANFQVVDYEDWHQLLISPFDGHAKPAGQRNLIERH